MIKNLATTVGFIKKFAIAEKKMMSDIPAGPKDVRDFASVSQFVPYVAPNSKLVPLTPKDEDVMFGSGKSGAWFLIHNDPTSWMLFVPVLCKYAIETVEKRKVPFYPVIFFHDVVNKTPVVKDIIKSFAGNSAATYREIVNLIKSDLPYHFGTCPEGSNCMYDYGGPVADFQQFALIKAALEGGANIAVITFKQKLNLAVRVNIPFINYFKKNAKGIRLPFFWLMQNPINAVYEVLDPGISAEVFNTLTKEQQKEIVVAIADRIKVMMEYRYSQLEEPK